MIQFPLENANIEIGDAQIPGPDGEPVSAKIMRITVPVSFVMPIVDDVAKDLGRVLSGSKVVVAGAQDIATLPAMPDKA